MPFKVSPRRLWNEEGYGENNPFDVSINYLYHIGKELKLQIETIDTVISEAFLEMANGKKYALDGCTCGCGGKNSGCDAIHEIRKRLRAMGAEIQKREADLLDSKLEAAVTNYYEVRQTGEAIGEIMASGLFGAIFPLPKKKLRTRIADKFRRKKKDGLNANS